MSDTTETIEHASHGADGHDDEHADHPGDKQYIGIAIFLAILTALEFLTYFETVLPAFINDLAIPILLILMAIKFFVVVAYFMHLKFDNKVLSQVFVFGIVLAVTVYFVMLQVFRFFSGFNTPA